MKAVKPRNGSQKSYIEKMEDNTITFGLGAAGCGKTFLAVYQAIRALKDKKVESIIITRPLVSAGEAIGHLPGDINEKAGPYLQPIYDAFQEIAPGLLQHLQRNGDLELSPLNYMRGRNLTGFVIADEMQNSTKAEMMMLLTRISGDNAKMVINGDPDQCDLRKNQISGLDWAAERLCTVKGIGTHYFSENDVVRHPLIRRMLKALVD